MVTFHTVGYSTEDDQVFCQNMKSFARFNESMRHCIIQGHQDAAIDPVNHVVELVNFLAEAKEEDMEGAPLQKLTKGLDHLRSLVNETSVMFTWSMEYDANIMLVNGDTRTEVLEFLAKQAERLDT